MSPSSLPTLLNQTYPYQYKDIIQSHVRTLLSKLPSLQPKISLFNHSNGKQVRLLTLEGTVPMYYRRNRYNIPVRIWLTEGYPQYPPLVYVVPTQDMELKPNHKHMDPTGRCYLTYLSEWKIQSHNLYDLCNYLGTLFGEDPPVFAKQRNTGPSPSGAHQQLNHSSYGGAQQRPPPPVPHHQQPPYQQNQQYPPSSYSSSQYNPSPSSSTTSSSSMYNNNNRSPYGQQQQFNPHQSQYSNPQQQKQQDLQAMQRAALQNTKTNLTHKIQSKLSQFRHEKQEKFQETLRDQREQQARISFQESEEKRLNQEFHLTEEKTKELRNHIDKLTSVLEEDKQRGDFNVEEMIEFADVLSQQDMELTAEDSAIEDCLYNLDKALLRELISSDVFLRNVRQLARRQFKVRALNEKVKKAQQVVR